MADVPAPSGRQRAGAAIAAACLVCAPLAASFEGLRTHPNPDPANPKLTQVCYGDTKVAMRTYTPDECLMLLRSRQTNDYAPPVLKCVPGLIDPARRNVFAAAIDAAYNGGPGAFCRSAMATAFNRGQWLAGCNAFPSWHVMHGTNVYRGLLRRREAERALCLKPIQQDQQP